MSSIVDIILRVKNAAVRTGLERAKKDFQTFSKDVNRLGNVAIFGGLLLELRSSFRRTREFQKGMKEVFTLLPGYSRSARQQMTKDVRALSKELGILPELIVPALYAAISAGVPADNVFDFLSTSAKAAKGGVTELATAVDGISSVVNAYGAEVLSATQASDLMFTAVRLGKTTFDEISQSVFQVTPLASALGIEFREITAALAALTAKGTPTAVAMTQIRALLADLAKEGSKSGEMFERVAGVSFVEFIRKGGTLAEALQMIKAGASATDTEVLNLFKRIEAGSAALSLLADNKFTDSLDEMARAAGATETAFQEMDTGVDAAMDKVEVRFKDGLDRMMGWAQSFVVSFGESMGGLAAVAADGGDDEVLRFQETARNQLREEGAFGPFMGVWNRKKLVDERAEELRAAEEQDRARVRAAVGRSVAAAKAATTPVDGAAAPALVQDPAKLRLLLAEEEDGGKSGSSIDDRSLASARARERRAQRDLKLSRMKDAERQRFLQEEQAAALAQSKIAESYGFGADAATLRAKAAELGLQLERDAPSPSRRDELDVNQLQRVGLASASLTAPSNFAQEKALALQEKMVASLAAIALNTDPDLAAGDGGFAEFNG